MNLASQPNRNTRARALIAALAKRDLVEVRRVEIVARDFAVHVESLDRAPSARELEHWLESHPQITEVSASDDALHTVLDEFLPSPRSPPTTVRHPDLERAIYQDEDPSRAIAVYADWLQERNDPFGEQLALGLDPDADRFTRYLRSNAERILGEHHREFAPLTLIWRGGFIDKIRDVVGTGIDHRPVAPEHWISLLQTRSCEMLRELDFLRPISTELDAALAEHAPPGLMSVILGHLGHTLSRLARRPTYHLSLCGIGIDLDADSFHPELEHLRIHVHEIRVREPLEWPNVRRLHVSSSPQVAHALSRIQMPRLERLTAQGDQSLFANFPAFVPAEQ